MIRRTIKTGVVAAAVVGTVYAVQRNKWDVTTIGLIRFGRAAVTVGRIALDYKISLRGLQEDSEQYLRTQSDVHLRSANLLLNLCSSNGGVFIKVGQHVGAMDYLLPEEYTSTLSVLHSRAPKSSLTDVFQVLREDLGKEPNELFSTFDEEPIGAASLAQVHRAVLYDGREVAVKVQHQEVKAHSLVDIATMTCLVNIIAWMFPEFSFMWLARETKVNLPLELDFLHEAKNAQHVRELLKFPWLKIPHVYTDLSTSRVLIMEFCPGGQVNDKKFMQMNGIDPLQISKQLGQLYSEMMFVKGYVHCDPHPGNILVQKTPKGVDIVLLDHGLYSTLPDQFRLRYSNLWMSLLNADIKGMKHWATELGVGEYYGLLACVMTARSWEAVQEGIDRKQKTAQESTEIKKRIVNLVPQISAMLAKVPREMLLMFKTNDLLRGIETNLGTYGSSFVSMSHSCVRAITDDQLKACRTWWCWLSTQLSAWWMHTKINIYNLYIRAQNFSKNLAIQNLFAISFGCQASQSHTRLG